MTAGEFLDTKMNVTKYDSNNKVIDKAPVRTDILAPGDNLDDIIYGPRGSTNNTDSAASNTQTNNRGISTPDRSETIQGTSGTALTGTAGSSPTALTGTAGNTNTALTGGTSTTALTGGTSTTALTGGETQQPIQLRQGMALS
jgi:hypothetical protein